MRSRSSRRRRTQEEEEEAQDDWPFRGGVDSRAARTRLQHGWYLLKTCTHAIRSVGSECSTVAGG